MAYSKDDFLRDLALFSAGGILGPTRTRQLLAFAGKKGIQIAALGARGAFGAATATAASPYAPIGIGAGLGAAALQTDPGQALLAASEERGRQDRIRYEMALQDAIFGSQEKVKRATKRKINKYSKAVGAGVRAVKASKFQGAKGKLTSPKTTFSTVAKITSRIKKGRKVSTKGVTGTIRRAVKRFL